MNTENHEYEVPPIGSAGWATRLNENFKAFETDIPLFDSSLTIDPAEVEDIYTPTDGAWLVARDTGGVHAADGTQWNHVASIPKTQTVTRSGDGTQTTFTFNHNSSRDPTTVSVTPTSQAAAGEWWVADTTQDTVTIEYATPPESGTDNLTWDVAVMR